MNLPELLAPAGSEAALYAAVQSGADAVYVGGSRFSARASANNFDEQAMQKAVDYCHLRGVKLYVTQNTLIKQSELKSAVEYAKFLYEIGVDGLIVQDLGLASAVSKLLPDFPLHASTQMTVHNLAGVRKLEKLGFCRVVLARELSEQQIAYIAKHCKAELEIFVHGALCYCYSGQCLFSSVLGGRSGNRGRCAQPCRLPYTLHTPTGEKAKSGYLMSPKDLALLDDLRALSAMGVASLKIEGRLKKPAYVATVTEVYRNKLDSGARATKQDMQKLLDAFNRSGFTDACFRGARGAEMMSVDNPSNVSPEKFADDIEVRCAENANVRCVGVTMECVLKPSHPAELNVTDTDGHTVTVYGDTVQAAQSRPSTEEEIKMRLAKTGGTAFCATEVNVRLYGDVFMPVGALNALRRNALELLKTERCTIVRSTVDAVPSYAVQRAKRVDAMRFSVCAETLAQAKAALAYQPEILYVPASVAEALSGQTDCKIAIKLPEILTEENRARALKRISTETVLVSGIGALEDIKKTLHTDFRIGVYNAHTAALLTELGVAQFTISPELNVDEIAALGDAVLEKASVIAYGRLPLMVMQNCLLRAYCGGCKKGQKGYTLRDRKNTDFPILCRPEACINVLLNSKPTYMADKLSDLKTAGVRHIRLDFTVESAEETTRVLENYIHAMQNGQTSCLFEQNTFTRGHFYRGVQ